MAGFILYIFAEKKNINNLKKKKHKSNILNDKVKNKINFNWAIYLLFIEINWLQRINDWNGQLCIAL